MFFAQKSNFEIMNINLTNFIYTVKEFWLFWYYKHLSKILHFRGKKAEKVILIDLAPTTTLRGNLMKIAQFSTIEKS